MNYDDEMLSDQGLRALALYIARQIVDAVLSKHNAGDDYILTDAHGAMLVDGYRKALSKAQQNMIAKGIAPKERIEKLVQFGAQIIAQQIPIAEKALIREVALSDAAKKPKR